MQRCSSAAGRGRCSKGKRRASLGLATLRSEHWAGLGDAAEGHRACVVAALPAQPVFMKNCRVISHQSVKHHHEHTGR